MLNMTYKKHKIICLKVHENIMVENVKIAYG